MADKKDCCNKGAALEALGWVLTNKKAWAVLLMIAKLSPQAIVRAVLELRTPEGATVWSCRCGQVSEISRIKCIRCGGTRGPML